LGHLGGSGEHDTALHTGLQPLQLPHGQKCALGFIQVSAAGTYPTAGELWCTLAGRGAMWRRDATGEAVTLPLWPSAEEALRTVGPWRSDPSHAGSS
jgi:hypothetical protein